MKIFLGVLSFLSFLIIPILLTLLFAVFVPDMITLQEQGIEPDPVAVFGGIGLFIAGVALISFLSLGLFIYFIVHLMQDPTATSETRVLWILLLFFFSNFVFPFYWYFRIWSNEDPVVQEIEEQRSN